MSLDTSRFFRAVLLSTVAVAILAAIGYGMGYRLNLTASYPLGVWRIVKRTPVKGDCVIFRPPEDNPAVRWGREVGILHWRFGRSTTMLKRIVAVPGDFVELRGAVIVNGVEIPRSAIRTHDQAGRAIPQTATGGLVPAGRVWLVSDFHSLSFDSRYFGHVDADAIEGVALPVFTW
jgi:conjugative transfer signal peptidase TraF